MKTMLLSLALILAVITTFAQTSVTIGNSSGSQGQIVTVPVTVTGCDAATGGTGITGIEMHFSYTGAVQYLGITGLYSGFSSGDWTFNGTGSQFIALWTSPTFAAYDIPNGTVLFNVQFIARNGGTSPLDFMYTGSQSILMDANFDIISGTNWNAGSVSIPAAAVTTSWNSTSAQSWSTVSNWSQGLPGLNSNVVVNSGTLTIDNSAFICNNLTVKAGAALTINSGITTTVPGSLMLDSDASGAPTGSLIILGALNVSGARVVKRYIPAAQNHFISTPLRLGTTIQSIYNPFNPGWAYGWDETTGTWNSMVQLSTPLIIGSGYVVNYTVPQTLTFSITDNPGFNMGNSYNPTTSYTNGNGWNLVGNPFLASLNWLASGYTKSKIDNAIYMYNGSTYASYVGGVGTNGATQYIPAMQGFFIHANGSGPNFVMPRSALVHDGQTFYKDSPLNVLKIRISNADGADETIIRLDDAAGTSFDSEADAYKLMSMDENVPQIFTIASEDQLSINTLPFAESSLIIPLSVKTTGDGLFELDFSNMGSFSPEYDIYLEDYSANVLTDLKKTSGYQFETGPGTQNRFAIRIEKSTGVPEQNNLEGKVFFSNGTLYVNGLSGTLSVYSINGQFVTSELISGEGLNQVNLGHAAPGVYMVKLVSGGFSAITKILVK